MSQFKRLFLSDIFLMDRTVLQHLQTVSTPPADNTLNETHKHSANKPTTLLKFARISFIHSTSLYCLYKNQKFGVFWLLE